MTEAKKTAAKKRPAKKKVVPMEPKEKTLEQIEAEAKAAAEKARKEAIAAEQKRIAELKAKYQMRGMTGEDLFKILALLGQLDIKDDFVAMYVKNIESQVEAQKAFLLTDHKEKEPSKAEALARNVRRLEEQKETQIRGVEIMGQLFDKVMQNISKVKIELNEFLGSLLGQTADEVAALPLGDYMFVLKSLFEADDFKTFFKSTASLLG